MNIENAKRAIAVMERVQRSRDHKFYMGSWFDFVCDTYGNFPTNEEEAVFCGTSACFLGWLALAPDIPEISLGKGDHIIDDEGRVYVQALAHFLEISYARAEQLCGYGPRLPGGNIYPGNATPQNVIDSINYLITQYEEQ